MIRHHQPTRFKFSKSEMPLREKIWQINWTLILLLTTVASVGFMTLYSAAGGSLSGAAPKLTLWRSIPWVA